MATGFLQVPPDSTGKKLRTYDKGTPGHDQYVIPTTEKLISFSGRINTFKTPGRAGVSRKLAAIHNATGSSVLVNINRIRVDLLSTVVKAVTVVTPVIRIHRFTAIPTNGSVLGKVGFDSAQTSNASVTGWGDASADTTSSATTLTVTIPPASMLSQVYAPRLISAAGYEIIDIAEFFAGERDVTLRALEGVVVFLDQAVTSTGDPLTDMWIASIDFDEYTLP